MKRHRDLPSDPDNRQSLTNREKTLLVDALR